MKSLLDRQGNSRRPVGRSAFVWAALVGLAALLLCVPRAGAAPEVDLHELTWYVHVDLINAGLGEDLDYWQGVLDELMSTSNKLLEGKQGPIDRSCCTRLAASVPLVTFGAPGDGLDVIDTPAEQGAISAIGTGSSAFLVDSITYCDGASPGAIGCALKPACTGNPNDDPKVWMLVTVDAFGDGTLASVIAHERGHNACLSHITGAPCQLMSDTILTPGLGACLGATECSHYRAGRTELTSGVGCSCHDDISGILADGAICSEGGGGICSGGLCGGIAGDARVHLLSASDPGDLGGPPEDAIRVSGLSGDWANLGQISATADDLRAMAYAVDSETLYGIVPSVFDDLVVTLDSSSGALISFIGAIANGTDEIVSMAYDPGETPAANDDRLIVLEVEAGGSGGEFRSIAPASPSIAPLLGTLAIGPAVHFSGMAYDSLQERLFLASFFEPTGFYEVDLAGCSPSCTTTALSTWTPRAWENASLAFSPDTGMLYLVGNLTYEPGSITTTFYAVVDPITGVSSDAISLDRFTPSALAALPEPGFLSGMTTGFLALVLTSRRPRDPPA
ncbi:MAG: hypothetical protein GY910_18040 [bacterium]|nr:hypothetical protein [Deltaproteobacteria bacterium]MCP4906877.1 hypothetical protein [bacterium]